MDPSRHEVFQYVSLEMPIIIEASITKARHLGNTQVTPLHVVERIRAIHCGLFCGICIRCETLNHCIHNTLSRIPFAFPAQQPTLADAVVVSIRTVINSLRGGWFSDMKDVEKLFAHLLDDPTVSNVMGESGFSITDIKNKLENRGTTVSICHV